MSVHVINLSINCKTATGDDTVIVCMNSDYVVRISTEDCGTFTTAQVKKLIVKHGKEYREVDIEEVEEEGETYLQASLPPIDWKEYVDLGVCGKASETSTPIYTSTSARFKCDDSVLNGVVILRATPVLKSIEATSNGIYKAADYSADGFYEVNVHTATIVRETRMVYANFVYGSQEILPNNENGLMVKVTVIKPEGLKEENIREGINIGGIVGTYSVPKYDGAFTITSEEEDS